MNNTPKVDGGLTRIYQLSRACLLCCRAPRNLVPSTHATVHVRTGTGGPKFVQGFGEQQREQNLWAASSLHRALNGWLEWPGETGEKLPARHPMCTCRGRRISEHRNVLLADERARRVDCGCLSNAYASEISPTDLCCLGNLS